MIEHLSRRNAMRFLREARRVLKPGGVLRLTTPDAVECCRIYLGLRDDVTAEHWRSVWMDGEFSPDIWINAQFNAWGHLHVYSFSGFADALIAAGFREPARCERSRTRSGRPELENLEFRRHDPPWMHYRTMFVEATK